MVRVAVGTNPKESLEDVSSSHAELAGHANHRQKIRPTVQLKEDRDNYREEPPGRS